MRNIVIGGALGIVAIAVAALAQPPGHEVLDGVERYAHEGCAVVEVRFRMPVAHLSHFPVAEARQLRVDVQLLHSPETLQQEQREAVRVAAPAPFNVQWVEFESGRQGRGVLHVEFSATTRFTVLQGRDFRSLLIAIPPAEGADSCDPEILRDRP